MERKSRFAQSYSAQVIPAVRRYALPEGMSESPYDLRGEPLQMPPWPGNLPHASASVS
jgi:hypothetical protein